MRIVVLIAPVLAGGLGPGLFMTVAAQVSCHCVALAIVENLLLCSGGVDESWTMKQEGFARMLLQIWLPEGFYALVNYASIL